MPFVEPREWDDFLKWFDDQWEPGKHLALIGPTGEGKSTFAVGALSLRKWILALDPKGEDETLSKSGFQRLTRWPPSNRIRDDIAAGKPARLIVGGGEGGAFVERHGDVGIQHPLDFHRAFGA